MKNSLLLGAALSLLAAPLSLRCEAAPRALQTSRSWVTLKAATDRTRYAPGQTVRVRLTATNTFRRGAYLRFSSGQRFDFSVFRAGTNESVYTWSATRMFLQATGALWLPPGQSQRYEAEIGDEMGQLGPGSYILCARLTNVPRPIVAAPIEFEIAAPTVAVTARTNKTTYTIGESVRIDMAATNRVGTANTLRFDSGLMFDVFISDEAGRPVWNYGANLRFIRALDDVTWRKGETKTMSATWDGVPLPGETIPATLEPGRYRVQAVLQSTPAINAEPVFIELTR